MKNFVQIRLETKNNSININNIKHNLRKVKTENEINENNNILIFDNKTFDNNKDIKKQYSKINKIRNNFINEHNEIYKSNNKGRKLPNYSGSISEGIITFSELINEKQKESNFKHNFSSLVKKSVNEVMKKLDATLIYISIHLDEKTPHCHFHYKNFDDKGKSIEYKNRNKETLSNLQDTVGEVFNDYGFKRGIKKDFTERNHQKTKVFKDNQIKELNENVNKLKNDNHNLQNKLDNSQKIIDKHINEIKEMYKQSIVQTKELRKKVQNSTLSNEDKKIEYSKISDYQKSLREEQKLFRKEMKSTMTDYNQKEINQKINQSFERFKSLGSKQLMFNNTTVFDNQPMETEFKNIMKELTNFNIIDNENQRLEKENNKLKEENNNLQKNNTEELKKDLERTKNLNISLNNTNRELKLNLNNSKKKYTQLEMEKKELEEKLNPQTDIKIEVKKSIDNENQINKNKGMRI